MNHTWSTDIGTSVCLVSKIVYKVVDKVAPRPCFFTSTIAKLYLSLTITTKDLRVLRHNMKGWRRGRGRNGQREMQFTCSSGTSGFHLVLSLSPFLFHANNGRSSFDKCTWDKELFSWDLYFIRYLMPYKRAIAPRSSCTLCLNCISNLLAWPEQKDIEHQSLESLEPCVREWITCQMVDTQSHDLWF